MNDGNLHADLLADYYAEREAARSEKEAQQQEELLEDFYRQDTMDGLEDDYPYDHSFPYRIQEEEEEYCDDFYDPYDPWEFDCAYICSYDYLITPFSESPAEHYARIWNECGY